MAEIAVSVLCPVYNHSKYLRKCLEGFVRQKTSFPFEVIVHDDASTDDSATIIREYAEKYPHIICPIYQKENQHSKKISYFRNFLYPAVRGKYFAICEGDDYWSDDTKLQKQFDALEAHPECSFSTHIVRNISEDGTILPSTLPAILKYNEGVINAHDLLLDIFEKVFYPFQTTSYFFRAELLQFISAEASEFINSCPALDYGWVLSALLLGNCYFIDQELSCYRRNSIASWSSRQKKKSVHSKFQERVSRSLAFYDRLSGERYHSLISRHIAENEYASFSYQMQHKLRNDPKYRPIYARFSSRQRFFLALCRYFPPFSPIYTKLKNTRSKQILLR